MATYENVTSQTFVAGADLSAKQYFFVKGDSTAGQVVVCGDGEAAIGVLLNDPTSGQAAAVAVSGKVRVEAGDTVAAGARVASDASGNAISAATGDYVVGVAVRGGADGEIIEVQLGTAASVEPA
jgi:hypothetical protein